ncbi:MAG TPA: DUF1285 domain-containing protein [Brevundimonas sp.]|jgi:hypothetical protein|uniref:DUF1285 domain-containing protein n=1 Tax=Brevundimonas sp. TaxID=1871086 RepID=UPI002E0F3D2B|nr:DUF1285 domain-containing protein [Brevundimonas sp.]
MTQSGTAEGLAAAAAAARSGRGLPPVHLWHPPHCGDIDILIRADGVWMHEGSPIGRAELVRLFSTILRLDPDGYHLVTPAEKLRIRVEDLPFRAVLMRREGDQLVFTTDVGDEVTADADHPVTLTLDPATGEPRPALHVRAGLEARIVRAVFYDLVEAAEPVDGRLLLRSGEATFDLGAVA